MIALALAAVLAVVSDGQDQLSGAHRRAQVFNGWAGAFTMIGMSLHIGGFVAMQSSRHRMPGLAFMAAGTVFNAHALVATGVGSWSAGRAHALDRTPPPAWKNPRLGWSLFGTGLAVFVASRIAPIGCFTTTCAVLTSEIGYFGGMTAMIVGLHAAGVGHGYRSGRRPSITPTAHWTPRETFGGLAVSGRF